MFKKLTAVILLMCMLICLVGCNDDNSVSSSKESSSFSSVSPSSNNQSTLSSTTNNPSSGNPSSINPSSNNSLPQSTETSSLPTGSVNTKIPEKTPIRVMSYNILHPEWCSTSSYVSVQGRFQLVRDIIFDYQPDVVGLQEVESSWHSRINSYICNNSDYKFACKYNNNRAVNMTTFIYNSKKLKLVKEYVVDIESNSDIRVLSVAVFERISDGYNFVVTNTHPAPPKTQAEKYKQHMEKLYGLFKAEMKNYNMPFIMTGDFNTTEQSSYYTDFMKNVGVKDAKYEAKTLVKDYCTFSGYKTKPKPGNSYCIDHIFVNDKVEVEKFDVIIDHSVEEASDHIPIYADIIFK